MRYIFIYKEKKILAMMKVPEETFDKTLNLLKDVSGIVKEVSEQEFSKVSLKFGYENKIKL
ncbi:hypothetical protein CHH83_02210 [Bacillus sp. 7586-K]|nr:hypothetical protein CHH83_02210 [Bacillus sp. 7586-K]